MWFASSALHNIGQMILLTFFYITTVALFLFFSLFSFLWLVCNYLAPGMQGDFSRLCSSLHNIRQVLFSTYLHSHSDIISSFYSFFFFFLWLAFQLVILLMECEAMFFAASTLHNIEQRMFIFSLSFFSFPAAYFRFFASHHVPPPSFLLVDPLARVGWCRFWFLTVRATPFFRFFF